MDGLSRHLADQRFTEMFRDELGWDCSSMTMAIEVDDRRLAFAGIAQKCGFPVLQCNVDRGDLCDQSLLLKAQGKIASTALEHILIYACQSPPEQVWQWAIRMPDGRNRRHTERPFIADSPPDSLLNRLRQLRFSHADQADPASVDGLGRVRAALDDSVGSNLPVRRSPLVERSDELAVAMAQGNRNAFDEFIVLHQPLGRTVGKWLERVFQLEAEDARQIAAIGLINAARRFDPGRGTRFSTYAMPWIRRALQQFGLNDARLIHLPYHVHRSFLPLRRELATLSFLHGRLRASDELTRFCDQDPRFFRQWIAVGRALAVRSLSDRARRHHYDALRLPGAAGDEPVNILLERERRARVRQAMSCLDDRERRLLVQRHTMTGPPHLLTSIARELGVSREWARKLVAGAEESLRVLLENQFPDLLPNRAVGPGRPVVPKSGRKSARRSRAGGKSRRSRRTDPGNRTA